MPSDVPHGSAGGGSIVPSYPTSVVVHQMADTVALECPHCGDRMNVPNEKRSIGGTFNCDHCGKLFYVNTARTRDGEQTMAAELPR